MLVSAACGGDNVVVVVQTPPVVRGVSISPRDTALHIGQIVTLAAAVDADLGLSRDVRWRSSDGAKASIDASGRVTAAALGAVTITATSIADTLVKGTAALSVVNALVVDVFTVGVAFSPAIATVSVGDTVRWNFSRAPDGTGHSVRFVGSTGAPGDIPTQTSGSIRRVFTARGTFAYACDVHPGMNGSVVVH
jgi:plastocyanin